MKTIHGIENFPASEGSIVTIGTFDGVHLGHQQILKQLIDTSQQSKLKSVLLTFFPHPRMVLQPDIPMRLIQTIEEREKALRKTGLDYLVIHPFSEKFSRLSADDYVKQVLVDKLNVRKVVVGYDHRFGRNRTASLEDMYNYADIYDFEVIEIDAKKIKSTAVSSTKIRNAIDNGNIGNLLFVSFLNYKCQYSIVNGKHQIYNRAHKPDSYVSCVVNHGKNINAIL